MAQLERQEPQGAALELMQWRTKLMLNQLICWESDTVEGPTGSEQRRAPVEAPNVVCPSV